MGSLYNMFGWFRVYEIKYNVTNVVASVEHWFHYRIQGIKYQTSQRRTNFLKKNSTNLHYCGTYRNKG